MKFLEALDRAEEFNLHPKARNRLINGREDLRKGRLDEFSKDRGNLVSLILLSEISRRQREKMEITHDWQVNRGRQILKVIKNIDPQKLKVYNNSAHLNALNSASEHSEFSFANHLEAFTNYLRLIPHLTGKSWEGIKKFPQGTAESFLILHKDPRFDLRTPDGRKNFKDGIFALERHLKTDAWKLFSSGPENFATKVRFADTMKPTEFLRINKGLGRTPKIGKNQESLLPGDFLMGAILKHKALYRFLEQNKGRAAQHFVVSQLPIIFNKMTSGKDLNNNDSKAIYALGVKVIENVEGRDLNREGFLLRQHEAGKFENAKLEELKIRLDNLLVSVKGKGKKRN